jgi:apolipoprotein D and lipocalin family protein
MRDARRAAPAAARACRAGLALPFGAVGAATAAAPVTTVAAVDLGRYVGTWYEIAHFPMFFQRNCIADTTATYAALPSGKVSVTNRCRTATRLDEARGKASVVPGTGNAQLKVSFFWPFSAPYWVIGLDPDYRWAVVGDPSRRYLWVLSRTPALPKALLDAALDAATAQGYDLAALKYTPLAPAPRAVPGP